MTRAHRSRPALDEARKAELIRFFEEKIAFNARLGMKVQLWEEGRAELCIPHAPWQVGDPFRPAVHGGVISTIADTCGGLAVFTLMTPEDRVATLDMRVDYLRPGQVDQDVLARSVVLRMGNRVAVTDTIVFQDDPDHPIAKAAAVYNIVRPRET